MMNNVKYTWIGFLMITWMVPHGIWSAESESTDPLMQQVNRLANLPSFTLNFAQVISNLTSGDSISANGKVYYAKPGLFRWDYLSSPKNVIANDGSHVYMIMPEDEQAFVETVKTQGALWSPMEILTDPNRISAEFSAKSLPSPKDSMIRYQLMPTNQNEHYAELFVAFDTQVDQYNLELTIIDLAGNENRLTLAGLIPEIPVGFTFTPTIPGDYEIADFAGQPISDPSSRVPAQSPQPREE